MKMLLQFNLLYNSGKCVIFENQISIINLRRLSADMSARTSVVIIFEQYQATTFIRLIVRC